MNLLGLQSKLESLGRYVPFTVEMVDVSGGSDRVDAFTRRSSSRQSVHLFTFTCPLMRRVFLSSTFADLRKGFSLADPR